MAEDVFLHIGAPKTGTSYLQLTSWQNRDLLAEAGVDLPLGRRQLQFDAVADMRGGIWSKGKIRATWAELVESTRGIEKRALVSEELLCATPREKIGPLVESLQPARVHVLLTARDIGRQVPAEWQQAVRARSPYRYGPWLAALRDDAGRAFWESQDPSQVLARWLPFVPAEQVHLVTVPPSGAPSGELWNRFASVIGLPEDLPLRELTHQNPSLGVHEAEILRRVNERLGAQLPMRDPYIEVVRDHLMRPVLFREDSELRLGVPDEHIGWINDRSREIRDAVGALGVNVVGTPDDLVSDVRSGGAFPDDLTTEELLDASVDTLIGILVHIEKDVLPELRKSRIATRRLRSRLRVARARSVRKDVPAATSRTWFGGLRRR